MGTPMRSNVLVDVGSLVLKELPSELRAAVVAAVAEATNVAIQDKPDAFLDQLTPVQIEVLRTAIARRTVTSC